MPLDPIVRFGGGPQIEELRAGLRSWLADHLPDEFRRTAANPDYLPRDAHERAVQFCQALHEQGWFVPQWPARFGGGGLGVVEQVVIREELAYAGAPLVNTNGVNMLAPVLFRFGTPEQQNEHLPKIKRLAKRLYPGQATKANRAVRDYVNRVEQTFDRLTGRQLQRNGTAKN